MYDDLIRFIRDWYQTDGPVPLHEPRFGDLDRRYVMDAIDSTFVSSVGEYVDRLEKGLSSFLNAGHAVAVVNGTAALEVALKLAGVGSGDEVITQPLTFVATANAISYNNAAPVFLDVDEDTLGLSPKALERFLDTFAVEKAGRVSNKTTGQRIAAILPMHTFGHPCRMDQILQIADHWHIPVVEDAAEAIGSKMKDRYCGTMGKLGVLSFNGNKTITCGGGGAIITDDSDLARKAKHLTTTAKVSQPFEFIHDEIGYNYRLPNLNAALACAQLEHLDDILEDKRKLAQAYQDFFKKSDLGSFVSEPAGCTSNYWLNAVILKDPDQRNELLRITNGAGIMTRPAWRLMCGLKMYKNCWNDGIETARNIWGRIVNLPSSRRERA